MLPVSCFESQWGVGGGRITKVDNYILCILEHHLTALLSKIGVNVADRNCAESLLAVTCPTWKTSTSNGCQRSNVMR